MAADTPPIGGVTGRPLSPNGDQSPARVRELAHEFEAMFLAQMLRQMRESMALAGDDEEEDGFGKTAFTETFDTELARHLSAAGGLGIAQVIVEAFEKRNVGTAGVSAAPEAVAAGRPATAVLPERPLDPRELGPMSSAFGWRRDPITGHGKFHRGIDVKAAYGQPVPSVAAGRVVSAGPEGTYGLTVVVEHDSGIRTRYAHLSEVAVRPGDAVARGQDIGRVGSTGRSTGPHLHFEVLDGGRRVDPAAGLEKLAGSAEFKELRAAADSSIGGVSAIPAAEE